MKTLKLSSIFVAIALLTASFANAGEYQIDIKKSSVEWKGSKVGGAHSGDIALKSGKLHFKKGALTGGSFVMDMTTINTTDLTGGKKKRLDGHLKNDDFFGVDKHPTSTLDITSVTPGAGDMVKVAGKITIKGVTQDITFDAKIKSEDGKPAAAMADIVFDRSKFGIEYKSGSFFENLGDKLIYDDVELKVSLVLKG